MADLNQYMNKAFDYEEQGYVEEAIQLCRKCMQAFPQYKNEIEFEIAKMNYRNGRKEQALGMLMALYQQTGDSIIHDLILGAYYAERQQEYEGHFRENCKLLKSYPHFFVNTEPSDIRYYPISSGENNIWYYDSIEQGFHRIERNRIAMEKGVDEVSIANDLLWMEDILLLEKMTRKVEPLMDEENAILLVYRKITWELLLQLFDLEKLIEIDRIVFYDDANRLEESFVEKGISFPKIQVGNFPEQLAELLGSFYRKRIQMHVEYQERAQKYYQENSEEVLEHIRKGRPKIFFITSRFTTALQYHARDCKRAAEQMGLQTEFSIEEDRILTKGSAFFDLKKIAEFQPDIIFMLDHFRYENRFLDGMDGVVCVCWIQDTLPWIFSKETALKQKERDVVISIFWNWEGFQKIGYREDRLLQSPMVANSEIYHPYVLSQKEKKQYGCDICFVCHWFDADSHTKQYAEQFPEGVREYVQDLYWSYSDYVRSTEHIFMKLEEFQLFIQSFIAQFYKIELREEFLAQLAEDMRTSLNMRLYRELLVDWLIDAGYGNIKLWGNGWGDKEKFKPYAMGPAQNGETLSKIFQASKIVVGNNIALSGASRVAEAMLSGAFYMANYIPPEADTCNIRDWLKEGDEIVFFKDKEDFLNKVHFYLEHEEERTRMAEIGRKKALEKLTYQKFMENSIKEMGNMF